jgi:hypothetical protein
VHHEAELARLKCKAMQQPALDAPPPLRCPGAHTIAECGGPCEDDFRLCDCGLLQQLNPAPAVKDSLTDAPAGSLVELLQREIGCAFPEDAQRGICAIAKWLDKNGFPVSAARLRRKAACPAPAAKESSAAASAKSLVQRMLNAMDEHFEAQRGPAPAGSLMERVGKARANARVLGYDEDRAAFCVVAAWLREKDSEREMGGDAAATADLIEQEASG